MQFLESRNSNLFETKCFLKTSLPGCQHSPQMVQKLRCWRLTLALLERAEMYVGGMFMCGCILLVFNRTVRNEPTNEKPTKVKYQIYLTYKATEFMISALLCCPWAREYKSDFQPVYHHAVWAAWLTVFWAAVGNVVTDGIMSILSP